MSGGIAAIDKASVHRICSGQVILDLATSVKELIENSVDAGATSITVVIKNYGADLIEVADNGSGIPPSDFAGIAAKYHTSKIASFSDVAGVTSFGFRGEALSSLCAVAQLSVVTRTSEEDVGARLEFDSNGNIKSQEQAARSVGTTVSIRDIFKPLPVRYKAFQRNIKREFVKLAQVLQEYAVGLCGVRLVATSQVKSAARTTVVCTQGRPTLRENIVSVFGAQVMSTLEPFEASGDGFKLTGFVSSAVKKGGKSNGERQFFYINSRPVDLPKAIRLVNESYRKLSSPATAGCKAMTVINVEVERDAVDVNVTPDKRTAMIQKEEALLELLKRALAEVWDPEKWQFAASLQSQSPLAGAPQPSQVRQSKLTSLRSGSFRSSSSASLGAALEPRNDTPADATVADATQATKPLARRNSPGPSEQHTTRAAHGPSPVVPDRSSAPAACARSLQSDEQPIALQQSSGLIPASNAASLRAADAAPATGMGSVAADDRGDDHPVEVCRSPARPSLAQVPPVAHASPQRPQQRGALKAALSGQRPRPTPSKAASPQPAAAPSCSNEPKERVQGAAAASVRDVPSKAVTASGTRGLVFRSPGRPPRPLAAQGAAAAQLEDSDASDTPVQQPRDRQNATPAEPSCGAGDTRRRERRLSSSSSEGMSGASRRQASADIAQRSPIQHAPGPAEVSVAGASDAGAGTGERRTVALAHEGGNVVNASAATMMSEPQDRGLTSSAASSWPALDTGQTADVSLVVADAGGVAAGDVVRDSSVWAPTPPQTAASGGSRPEAVAPPADAPSAPMSPGDVVNVEDSGGENGPSDVVIVEQATTQARAPSPGVLGDNATRALGMDGPTLDGQNLRDDVAAMGADAVAEQLATQQAAEEAAALATALPWTVGADGRLHMTVDVASMRRRREPSRSNSQHAALPLRAQPSSEAASTSAAFKAASLMALTNDGTSSSREERERAAETELERVFRKADFARMRVHGQFNLGFILASTGGHLFIVDQHAADEKFNFERLRDSLVLNKQPLMHPLGLGLSAIDEITLREHMPLFEQNGFAFVEDPQSDKLQLASLPFSKGTTFGVEDVHELIHMIHAGEGARLAVGSKRARPESGGMSAILQPSKVRAMLAMRACRGSIMIGTSLNSAKMTQIVHRLAGLDAPWNCPHGRPTMRHIAKLPV